MRNPTILWLAVLATIAAPLAQAGAQFTDPLGDLALAGPSPSAVPDNPQTRNIDLVGLNVIEEDLAFTFVLKMQSLEQQGGTTARYTIPFTWLDAQYRISVTRTRLDPTATPSTQATFQQSDGQRYSRVLDLDVTEDLAASTLSIVLSKNSIISLEGHAPIFGSQLPNVTVRAWTSIGFGPGASRIEDQMPDAAPGVIVYELGGYANGHLALEAPDPVRVSNGGATTFVFQAHLQNSDTADDAATIKLEGAPADWDTLVQPGQRIPAEDERPIFALITIPFGHQHGGFSGFNMTATSSRDPSITASIRFGVLYTPIPMPAGHHPEIFLHASAEDTGVVAQTFGSTTNTMSTVEDHADDVAEALAERTMNGGAAWDIPLGPALALGLDFDLNRTGALEFNLLGRRPGAATISAELLLVRGDEELVSLVAPVSADVTLDAQAATPVALVLTPSAESDYVPYASGQNLLLRLRLESTPQFPCCPTPDGTPAIVTGSFRMPLPLNEYADLPVWDEGIESSVQLTTLEPVERDARPGTTVTYTFTVTNNGDATDEVELGVVGAGAEGAAYLPDGKVELSPGASVTATLAVRIPADAVAGDRLEAVFIARSETDPSNIALVRTATTVSPDAANEDEEQAFRDAAGKKKDTPLPLAFVLIALSGALMARRLRRY